MDRLLTIRPEATPNLVVVEHADTVLGRGGDLLRAVTTREAQTPEAVRMRAIRRSLWNSIPNSMPDADLHATSHCR